MSRPLRWLRGRLGAFYRDSRGNILVLFTFTLVPVLGLLGIVVDFGRTTSVQADMQAALDSTALRLAKSPSLSAMSNTELQTKATSYFNAVFNRPDTQVTIQTAAYDQQTSSIVITANAAIPTTLLGGWPLAMKTLNVTKSTTVKWGISNLQVALVLDNTGSMADYGKLTNLKTAAHQLLAQLQAAAQAGGSIRVAIVPFTTDVNIGTAAADNWWIDWSSWSTQGGIENNMTCGSSSGWNWSCGWGWGWNTITCGSSNHSGWNGCVMDRGGTSGPDAANYDVLNTPPVSGPSPAISRPTSRLGARSN